MKKLILICTLFIGLISTAQDKPSNYTTVNQKYYWMAGKFKTLLLNDTTLLSTEERAFPALATRDDTLWIWSPGEESWITPLGISGANNYLTAGTFSDDTITLTRSGLTPIKIDLNNRYLKLSDSAAMLNNYLRAIDTSGHWITDIYERNDTVFYILNGTETFAYETSDGVVSDGDKGDITVSSGVWTIDNSVITNDNIVSLAFSKLTGTPTTLAGYGITDGLTQASADLLYEPIITAGTTSQYWRGDKTWQTFPSTGITSLNGLSGTTQTFSGVGLNITSTGTNHAFSVDSLLYTTRLRTQHVIDSLQAINNAALALKLNISDTAAMLDTYVQRQELKDTAQAIRADIGSGGGGGDYNLLVESLGTGEDILVPRNDTLYGRTLEAGFGVIIDTLANGGLRARIDSANSDVQTWIGGFAGGGMDSLEVVAYDSLATNNVWVNSTVSRLKFRHNGFYYTTAITDSTAVYVAPSGYDSDAQAFFTAAGITDNTQKTAVNDLVLDLKAASLWTNAKAIYPFVGGTATTHKYNLRNPVDTDGGFRLVWNGTWTHNSNGITGDGTTAYAQTFLVPSAQFTELNASFAYVSKTDLNIGTDFGANDGGGGFFGRSRSTGSMTARINGGTVSNTVASSIGSFIGTSRTGPAQEIYKDGVTVGTGGLSDYRTNYPLFIGSLNNAGTSTDYSARNFSFMMFYAASLSDAEAATLHTIMTDFNTALSR